MKVLFINSFGSPDYLNDMIYHGLASLNNIELHSTVYPWYMFKSALPHKNRLYGKGFSIYCKLEDTHIQADIKMLLEGGYDKVIYGSIWRDKSYLEAVLKRYPKNKIIILDGEDTQHIGMPEISSRVRYFKRELAQETENIYPIQFSIPKENFINVNPKTKMLGHIIPGNTGTYIFDNEEDYYNDYNTSFFGHTQKKAGWDCLRHYEIIAARCVPIFRDLDKCPPTTMFRLPKDILSKVNEMTTKGDIPDSYADIELQLNDFALRHLTTEKMAEYLIS